MRRTLRRSSGIVVVAASMSLVACSVDSFPTSIAPPSRSLASTNGNAHDLPIYGLGGLRRATPQSPCADGNYRQFDFWLGNWKVYSLTGAFVATSRILNTLDGCVIEENWAPLNGLRGRSLSSYDAESGVWRQTWVPENSQNGRPIRLAGGLRSDGVMDMSGQRRHWFFGYTIFDHFQWTPVDANHVIQSVTLDIPQLNIHSAGAPHYERTTDPLPPTTSPGTTRCLAGGDAAESRNFDFTVGNWKLTAANGLAIGTSSIAVDPTLSGCLTIESFSTPKGYRAISWLYYDALENTYFRTYVDTEGERVEMRGTFDNGVFTMEGAEPIHGANGARVRMTWKQTSATTTLQTWEVSRDGETWREVQAITFTRE